MKSIDIIEEWGDKHHPKMLDTVRVLLGLFLMAKGYGFITHFPFLREVIVRTKAINFSYDSITVLIYYVALTHLLGGVFIFIGLITRAAALFQIPVVFGAVFFVNILNPYFNSELWLSGLVLILLMLFVVIGSGPLSVDHFLNHLYTSENPPDTDL